MDSSPKHLRGESRTTSSVSYHGAQKENNRTYTAQLVVVDRRFVECPEDLAPVYGVMPPSISCQLLR